VLKLVLRKQFILLTLYLLLAGCQTRVGQPASPKTFYFAIEANTPEEKRLGQDVLHEASRRLQSGNDVVVDFMKDSQVINLFSDKVSTLGIREAMNDLGENQSNVYAIVKAVDRAVKLGNNSTVSAVIVTSGTSDVKTLAWMTKLTEQLPSTTTLYFVGLEPENRLPMSSAFVGVRNRVKFAVLDEEWITIMKHL
jgi:hypothetical protein